MKNTFFFKKILFQLLLYFFLALEYTVLSPSEQKPQCSSTRLPLKPLSRVAVSQGGHSFRYTWVCMCLQIWGPGENPSQRKRHKITFFLVCWFADPIKDSDGRASSVAQCLHPGLTRQWLRAAHSWQQPDVGLTAGAPKLHVRGAAQIQFCSTCCWVSSCSAWFANTGEACSRWS